MTSQEIQKILSDHKLWLDSLGKEGIRAYLSGANLSRADLSGANLSRANLSRANLSRANLSRANLFDADLLGANLSGADLSDADLSDADLSRTDITDANIQYTKGTDLVQFSGFGSQRRCTTYSKSMDCVWCGCFIGTLAEFEAIINKTYPEPTNKFRLEYLLILELIKKHNQL